VYAFYDYNLTFYEYTDRTYRMKDNMLKV